ncbi:metal ABC transporter ATP-binding protein [candidate division WOR-3 bacterium]|nr:metal ABC transporter ATP-binding protein [candidate division WOR-3 bacterium]
MNEKSVLFDRVTVKFRDNIVLENIYMDVAEGEIIAVVGPNGAGKTTLLRTMMGIIKPCEGFVKVFGKTPDESRKEGFFGYVPQLSRYEPGFPLSAKDVVSLSRYAKKNVFEKLTKRDKSLIEESLQIVGMKDQMSARFGELSGGQKQRVLIARALAFEPKILVLDEPSTGLDTVSQESFYKLLVELRESRQLTIFIVSHDIGAVSFYIDKIACLSKKMHFHGKLEGCLADENLKKFLGAKVSILIHDEQCLTCRKNNARNS